MPIIHPHSKATSGDVYSAVRASEERTNKKIIEVIKTLENISEKLSLTKEQLETIRPELSELRDKVTKLHDKSEEAESLAVSNVLKNKR